VRPLAVLALSAALLSGCGGGGDDDAPERTPSAKRTPAPRTDLASVAKRAKVPVLCYHQIRAQTAGDSAADRAYIVSPKALDAQLTALEKAGYTTVTGDAVAAHVARGAPLPRKPVLLTFDDGTDGQYTRALPLLRKHDMIATFFPMTVVLGKPGWMTRGQVRKLDRAGMTIGAHTYDHKAVPEYEGDDWIEQVAKPKLTLTEIVGHKITLFAYPFGLRATKAYPYLRRAHFSAAFQLADELDRDAPMLSLRRIIVPQISGKQLLREIRRNF
jgi:peptidoglycan/xylan/chitin deacetylase (PgdA/CDA1 family)